MSPIQITAKPKLYPHQLMETELQSHKQVINEYQDELSAAMFESAASTLPDVALINQQPELKLTLRGPLLDFLFKVAKRTKVTKGIFYKAARLMDRYCSKRIVLRDQAQLVAGTCLWLAAKTSGGCNHIISSSSIPSGGRFMGPTIRSRIPRLSELVQLCGPSCGYDEGMFIQMERHILETLNWDVCDSSIYNWCFNLHDYQCLNDAQDYQLTIDDRKVAAIKNFLIENSIYSLDLIAIHPSELALIIKKILVTLILNDEKYFNIKLENLTKILARNSIENYDPEAQNDGESQNRLLSHFKDFNMNLANRLLLSVANVTPTVLNSYTSTEFKEVNEVILKVHKVAISHIMALHEENKAKAQQQQQQQIAAQQQYQQQQHHQQQKQSNSPQQFCQPTPVSTPIRNNYAQNTSPSSESDYSDADSVMSGELAASSVSSISSFSSPMNSPGMVDMKHYLNGAVYGNSNGSSRSGSFVIPNPNQKFIPYSNPNAASNRSTSSINVSSRKGASFSGKASAKYVMSSGVGSANSLKRVASSQMNAYEYI